MTILQFSPMTSTAVQVSTSVRGCAISKEQMQVHPTLSTPRQIVDVQRQRRLGFWASGDAEFLQSDIDAIEAVRKSGNPGYGRVVLTPKPAEQTVR